MKKILKRKKLIIVLAIIVVAIIALVVYAKNRLSAMSTETSIIQLQEIKTRDLSDSISLTGTVSGENSMNYSSSATAEILTINVSVGDEVQEGDVLATLDQEAIQSQIDMLEKSIANAQALTENQNKLNQHALDLAKSDQETQLAAASQSITDAQNELNSATTTYNNLNSQVTNLTNQMNATSNAEEKASLSEQLATAKAELAEAQSAMSAAEKAVTEAQNNYNSVKSSTDEAIYSAQNTVDAQQYSETDDTETQTQLDQLYEQLNDCTVTCQSAGIVTAVNVSVGDTNTANATLVTVENDNTLVMTASVGENDILKLQEGMKAVVTSNALDDTEISGEVIRVVRVYGGSASSESDMGVSDTSSGGFSVQIRLDDCELLSGMSAKAKVILTDKTDALSVPYDLIMTDENDQSYVLCAEDNGDGTYTAVRKDIETGEESDYYVEVLSGDVSEGDYIIMDYEIAEGDVFSAEITMDESEEE